jgi:SAM-dependent methyltransferase
MAAWARALKLDVFPGTLAQARLGNETYDVVASLEVLEHLTDPVEWLEEIRRVLRPRGLLLLSTPNAACAERYGNRWSGFKTSFEHLTFFDLATLDQGFKKVGLCRVAAWTCGEGVTGEAPHSRPVATAAKKLAKKVLASFPPLQVYVSKMRLAMALRPAEKRPFGHNLWVLAQKSPAAAGPRPS